jgi:ArsR family transcriptional regulator
MNAKTPNNIAAISDHKQPNEPGALLALCKASADQLRLDILQVLSRDSFGVLELCSIFDAKQSGMSHHLKILANAGLVTTRREGNSIFYRRSHRAIDDGLHELQQALHASIDRQPLATSIQTKVDAIQAERAASSQVFFTENADKFSQQQEQIAAYDLYGPNTVELLSRSFNSSPSATTTLATKVIEVGPGEGAFLAELSPRFQQVYALDNSQQMLNKAEALATDHGLTNITFIHGDTKDPKLTNLACDCAVINMVLHHIPSPADIFFDLAKVLKKNGQLFITDLCSHDQSWARESCGDVWLGFEPEDLTQWAADAGFKTGENIYLAQRNGFRVQIRQFIKL